MSRCAMRRRWGRRRVRGHCALPSVRRHGLAPRAVVPTCSFCLGSGASPVSATLQDTRLARGGGCVSRPLSFAENKVDRFHVTSRVKCALRGSREWSASSPARTAPWPRPRRLRGQLAPARAPCRQGFPERGGDLRTGELLRP